MATSDLGPWEPLPLDDAVAVFARAPFRWWVSGGVALELHVDRTWRAHDDTDVGICRDDVTALRVVLDGWSLHVAAAGTLRRWLGEPLHADEHENNLWCRRRPEGPWELDITIGSGSAEMWIDRRDPTRQLPWDEAVLTTAAGIPYLAPEVQLLFKAKHRRPKDDVDAGVVVPLLDERRRRRLAGWLSRGHPWQELLGPGR